MIFINFQNQRILTIWFYSFWLCLRNDTYDLSIIYSAYKMKKLWKSNIYSKLSDVHLWWVMKLRLCSLRLSNFKNFYTLPHLTHISIQLWHTEFSATSLYFKVFYACNHRNYSTEVKYQNIEEYYSLKKVKQNLKCWKIKITYIPHILCSHFPLIFFVYLLHV